MLPQVSCLCSSYPQRRVFTERDVQILLTSGCCLFLILFAAGIPVGLSIIICILARDVVVSKRFAAEQDVVLHVVEFCVGDPGFGSSHLLQK